MKIKYFIDLSTEWREWDNTKSIHEIRWVEQVNEISCHPMRSIHETRWIWSANRIGLWNKINLNCHPMRSIHETRWIWSANEI